MVDIEFCQILIFKLLAILIFLIHLLSSYEKEMVMILAGILFLFGIVVGIQILHILFSSWFWRFLAYTVPLACVLLIVLFGSELKHEGGLWIALLITTILSIPMFILENKGKQSRIQNPERDVTRKVEDKE